MPRIPEDRPPTLRPLRALAHPAWWVALALLAANDHLFKGAGVLPSGLTGKLSDFAGLLVAPILLAALFGVTRRRGLALAHAAVGAGFAAINISPAVARMVEAATLPTPFPWMITVDPTDLVALPMLVVSFAIFARWCARPIAVRPAVSRLGVALGGVACVATSPPPEPGPLFMGDGGAPPPGERFSEVEAPVALLNISGSRIVVRTRALRAEVAVDCAAVAADPSGLLTPDLFAAPILWDLQPETLLGSRQIDPASGRGCTVALLSTPTSQRLLFVAPGDHADRTIRHVAGESGVDDAIIPLRDDGETIRFDEHRMLFNAPAPRVEAPDPACVGPEPGAGLAWTAPPVAEGFVIGHSIGPDGCHAIDMLGGRTEGRWYICAPGAPIELEVDDHITLRAQSSGNRQELTIESDRRTIVLSRGIAPRAHGLTVGPPDADDACRASWRDACHGVVSPLVVRDAEGPLPLGEPTLSDGATVTVIRAERPLVADGACDPWRAIDDRVELVIDRPFNPALPASEDAR